MFPDARVAPVHKDGSFTLVSSGLKDHLEDKLYNSMRTGAEFKKCIQEAFAMVRTEQVTMLDESRRATSPLVRALARPHGDREVDPFILFAEIFTKASICLQRYARGMLSRGQGRRATGRPSPPRSRRRSRLA